MNNNFDRTKAATARFSTRAIALMLFFVMLLTAIGSGSVISAIATEINSTVSADAIPEAATEGSTIALNAIPGETVEDAAEANDAQPAPDLSEFEENEIVRGMKDDLAGSGANADLTSTGSTGHTVYMCPHNLGWDAYSSFKVFVQDDDKGQDYSAAMSLYSKTLNGYPVYTLTVYEDDGGWRHFQFWAIDDDDNIADIYSPDNPPAGAAGELSIYAGGRAP